MIDVFISYSRRDVELVSTLARAMEAEGYRVWWDAEIAPHQSYGDVITAKIELARAALVVWSRDAVGSEWVRAEADMARNHRKLIQTAIDGVAPPLPFNQIQYADLTGWRGEADNPGWVAVKRSLEDLCGPRVADGTPRPAPPPVVPRPLPPAPPPPAPAQPLPATSSNWPLFAGIGIGVVALAIAGGVLLGQRGPAPASAPASIAPTEAAPMPTSPPVTEAAAPTEEAPADAGGADIPLPNAGDMTFADSSTRLIEPHEIAMMGPSTLKVARNEIYARKGRRFQDPWLRDWFSRYAWYRPRYDEVPLNPIEAKNVELIKQAEAKYGG
jgi:hypothetical protein